MKSIEQIREENNVMIARFYAGKYSEGKEHALQGRMPITTFADSYYFGYSDGVDELPDTTLC